MTRFIAIFALLHGLELNLQYFRGMPIYRILFIYLFVDGYIGCVMVNFVYQRRGSFWMTLTFKLVNSEYGALLP